MSLKIYPSVRRDITPQEYILQPGLKNAVEVAIALRQPLLVTGEPGTGKTRLADKVAWMLAQQKGTHFLDKPLVFNTKTSSASRDLFYTYDAMSHYQAANIKREEITRAPKTADFIELQAFGQAIAMTNPASVDTSKFKTPIGDKPVSSVVLIDEIDKAPRDFTNDILHEVDRYEFEIKEQNYRIKKGADRDIVVIMTSNSEKNLPDAFLRRCVFYHIPFPDDALLKEIAFIQLGKQTKFTEKTLGDLLKKFKRIRESSVRKPPATAELMVWLKILEIQGFLEKDPDGQRELLLNNLSVLVKTKEDLDAVKRIFR